MILALFGGSHTGKTTIARRLEEHLGFPRRSCGEEVRHLAAAHGCDASDLPDEQRRVVDRETLKWVRENVASGGIVEGRFLDAVLLPVRELVFLVEVRAEPEVRAERWAARAEVPVTPAEIAGQDRTDAGFRERIYSDSGTLTAELIANTNRGTSEWVALLETRYRTQLQKHG